MPKRVRTALVNDAFRQGISVNEAAARILSARCGVLREPAATRFVPVTSEGRLSFRVPAEVRRCLRLEAADSGATIRGLVIAAFAEEYGIPFDGTARRPRGSS